MLFTYRAADPPQAATEQPLRAGVDLLTARGGHDEAGRFLPVFVRVSSDLWLPPIPAYATLATMSVRRAPQPARFAAAMFAALGIVLAYAFAVDLFGSRAFGWIAALLLLANPAYAIAARSGALDGVWIVPPLLVSLIAVARFAETRSRRSLAVA